MEQVLSYFLYIFFCTVGIPGGFPALLAGPICCGSKQRSADPYCSCPDTILFLRSGARRYLCTQCSQCPVNSGGTVILQVSAGLDHHPVIDLVPRDHVTVLEWNPSHDNDHSCSRSLHMIVNTDTNDSTAIFQQIFIYPTLTFTPRAAVTFLNVTMRLSDNPKRR